MPVTFHGADISEPDQIDAMVDHIVKAYGKLDCIVNNAGEQQIIFNVAAEFGHADGRGSIRVSC